MRILKMSAKCSDLFFAQLGNKEYDGCVPNFFPGKHYGDYVQLEIDIDTGQITNWKKPTEEDLEIFS